MSKVTIGAQGERDWPLMAITAQTVSDRQLSVSAPLMEWSSISIDGSQVGGNIVVKWPIRGDLIPNPWGLPTEPSLDGPDHGALVVVVVDRHVDQRRVIPLAPRVDDDLHAPQLGPLQAG